MPHSSVSRAGQVASVRIVLVSNESDTPQVSWSLLVDFLLVGAGGAMGALARYLLGEAVPAASEVVTLGINVSGAFLLGLLVAVLAGRSPRVQLLLGTGLLGGFTTYSLLSLQVAELAQSGRLGLTALYGVGTVVLGFVATLVGVGTGGVFRRHLRRRP